MTGNDRASDDRPARRAPLLRQGQWQVVLLPPAFRFDGNEVEIRREGDAVILEPVSTRTWPVGYWTWVEAHRDDLELGRVEEMGGGLRDGH